MKLLAEVPGGRRARVVMFMLLAISTASVHSVDRFVTAWFVGLHFPDPPIPQPPVPGATTWDPQSI
jgi:hypothetical protein